MPHIESQCLFVSDLHGSVDKFNRLFANIVLRRPMAVFLGGDILPSATRAICSEILGGHDFLLQFISPRLAEIRSELGDNYPSIFTVLGNDDSADSEPIVLEMANQGLWHYAHNRVTELSGYHVLGYSFVPPTPFLLKDWERYDVSRFVDAGCISPEEGFHTQPISNEEVKYATIEKDLRVLSEGADMKRSIFLFHTPPYQTKLDRANLDGKKFDGVSLDPHIGSIAVRRFIEQKQPLLTLHGHVHESPRLTGAWQDQIANTRMFSAAHDGPELALLVFDFKNLDAARRELQAASTLSS